MSSPHPHERPVVIACAHGTRNEQGQQLIRNVVAHMQQARPDLDIREAYVDVQEPSLETQMQRLQQEPPVPGTQPVVIVPLLLSVGFHVNVDIQKAAKTLPGTLAAKPLGPDAALADLLWQRLETHVPTAEDHILLAAAGSSNPRAAKDVENMVALLQHRATSSGTTTTISACYGASYEPSVPDAVAAVRQREPARCLIASYLLAPGFFHDRLAEAGADQVSLPLLVDGGDKTIADLVLRRLSEALA